MQTPIHDNNKNNNNYSSNKNNNYNNGSSEEKRTNQLQIGIGRTGEKAKERDKETERDNG